MRDIKFRAWSNIRSSFIYWEEICKNKELLFSIFNKEYFAINPIKYLWKLQQYTGVVDKNGVEIYEGDIVKYKSISRCEQEELEYTQEIRYSTIDTAGFIPLCWEVQCDDGWYSYKHKDYEVVGNIYENPELLDN